MPSDLTKKRILVGHTFWGRGGAEISAMWLLQSLLRDYHVDVVTRGGWDIDELNHIAGTDIPKNVINVRYAPFSKNIYCGAFWIGFYKRYCRSIADQYDLCVTASRVIDWGVPAVHFLTDVTWNNSLQIKFNSDELQSRKGFIRSVYWKLESIIAGRSWRKPEQFDVIVANSEWTAAHSRPYCRLDPVVIYPPVPGKFHDLLPWQERENSFVCLGRISVEKQIDQVIYILDAVRESNRDIKLHIVGRFDTSSYSRHILNLQKTRTNWIILHDGLYGAEKEALLGRCRYGISSCTREAFGIATAEMLKAGIIPVIPFEGAQKELINDTSLTYTSHSDAVDKINLLLASEEEQLNKHLYLLRNCCRFDTDKFKVAVAQLFDKLLSGSRRSLLSNNRVSVKINIIAHLFNIIGLNKLFYWLNRSRKKVLSYHNILSDEYLTKLIIDSESHNESMLNFQLEYLSTKFKYGCDIGSSKELSLTFDDGYENLFTYAHKILSNLDIRAYFFIATDLLEHADKILVIDELLLWISFVPYGSYTIDLTAPSSQLSINIACDKDRMSCWIELMYPYILKDRDNMRNLRNHLDNCYPFLRLKQIVTPEYYKSRLTAISQDQLLTMIAYGHFIGSHSKSHPILSMLGSEEVSQELSPRRTCRPFNVNMMAYPFGGDPEISKREVILTKEFGYEYAFANVNYPLDNGMNYGKHYFPRISLPNSNDRAVIDFTLSGAKHFIQYLRLLPCRSDI